MLSATTGTSGSFRIPTRFSGDVLATMQATYPDGTPAGPTTWLPQAYCCGVSPRSRSHFSCSAVLKPKPPPWSAKGQAVMVRSVPA
ncbi:hypothetical protein ACWDBD_31035 [Streptomyces sp. NPDC001118]